MPTDSVSWRAAGLFDPNQVEGKSLDRFALSGIGSDEGNGQPGSSLGAKQRGRESFLIARRDERPTGFCFLARSGW